MANSQMNDSVTGVYHDPLMESHSSLNDSFSSTSSYSVVRRPNFVATENNNGSSPRQSISDVILVDGQREATVIATETHDDVFENELLQPLLAELTQVEEQRKCQPVVSDIQTMNLNQTTAKSKRINAKPMKILAEPRPKFRPRTEIESRISSHYVRSNEHPTYDHPTIQTSAAWAEESNFNFIEVALVDVKKQAHPYILLNKSSSSSFSKQSTVVQQDDENVLYYPLFDTDFKNGYKTFVMELIKPKQGGAITKQLIQTKQLYRSMLRFTRCYLDKDGEPQKDASSEVFSCIMTEHYGDVSIERMSPQCGGMITETQVFLMLRGRAMKNDLKVTLTRPNTNWCYEVKKVTTNATTAFFMIPPCAFLNEDRVQIDVHIECKGEFLQRYPFLHLKFIDQQLSEVMDGTVPAAAYSPSQATRRSSRSKLVKRLTH